MDDIAPFHRDWLEFRAQRSREIRQELRFLSVSRTLGQRIRTLRLALGLTQRQLASALGVSVRTVIRYERGQCKRRPRHQLMVALIHLELAHAESIVEYLQISELNPSLIRGIETRFG